MALGGGCELAIHCARRVASLESYIGLVEVGVGLIPGGGGLPTARAARPRSRRPRPTDLLLDFLKNYVDGRGTAQVSVGDRGAGDGLPAADDRIVFNGTNCCGPRSARPRR
jgi:3-hydroxyacyl-CoA dehydrogenase